MNLKTTTERVIVYGRPACPMVPPVLHALDTAEVPYTYVDIRQDADGRDRVRAINGGNESVPTLVFPDGSTLTEPGLGALRQKLAQMGHADAGLDSVGARVGFALQNPAILFVVLAVAAIVVAVLLGL